MNGRTPLAVAMVAMVVCGACRKSGSHSPGAGPAGARRVEAGGPEPGLPRDGGTLRVHMEVEPPTLNPLVEHDHWTRWIGAAIYEPLLRQDASGTHFQPALATAWEQPDERTLRITLRAGVTWHDGKPLSAADVVATFARLREPGTSSDARADFEPL